MHQWYKIYLFNKGTYIYIYLHEQYMQDFWDLKNIDF